LPARLRSWPQDTWGRGHFCTSPTAFPGRANRWLARSVDGAFAYFQSAADEFAGAQGGKWRECRCDRSFCDCRRRRRRARPWGWEAGAPVLLVMGGSQGAGRINELLIATLPQLLDALPQLQFIHLTGSADLEKVRAAHASSGGRAVVRAFLGEMAVALAAADAAVSRAGASSLAEFAACRLPRF